jgi:F-type H+-transporting ATPase subunit b
MADGTTATTAVPPKPETGGFPPFKTETFPSQFFWLAITFVLLFVVLWRVAGPRIAGTITSRRNRISDDLAAAQENRAGAQAASAAYQTALTNARDRAQTLADEARKAATDELSHAKAEADARAAQDIAAADARITASRAQARSHVVDAARDATIDIVARLTGETVSADDAAAAVRAALGS